MKKILAVFVALMAFSIPALTVDLFYTEDGRTVKSLKGFFLNDNYTIVPEGDDSWLLLVGQKVGPNGYTTKDSKLTLGTLGKSRSLFTLSSDDFLGFGHGRQFDRAINISQIAYIYPDTQALQPVHVVLNDGTTGELFVAGDYTESQGQRIIQGKVVNGLSVIKLHYDIPKSQRGANTMPSQIGFKAKAVSFSDQGVRRAMREILK